MHSPSAPDGPPASPGEVKDKGLKKNAISFVSNVVIGVASTAPAYSLASALGAIAGVAAFGTPAVIVAAFIPMFFISLAYFHLNRADPDCGTTFSWATRAMGPHMGWLGGWAVIATNILVMPSLAAIAGQYTFQLFGFGQPSTLEVTLVGLTWIAVMTAICYSGIELSARSQQILLAAEVIVLLVFAAAALAKVYGPGPPEGSVHVAPGWFNPFAAGNLDSFMEALLIAVFIYWGWDSGVAVNEETRDPRTAPGKAAIASTFLLLGVYVLVAVAAIAFAGPGLLSGNKADVFAPIGESVLGPGLSKILILAVLTSASASTQTTILPAARTALSMAGAEAIPKRFAGIHPRYLSPGFATLAMGGVSAVWYAGLTILSKNVLEDSILAIGLCIAFYYALTGFTCVVFFRRELLKSARNFISIGLLPGLGGLIMLFLFVKSCVTLQAAGATKFLGVGAPLVIGIGALLAGVLMMAFVKRSLPDFFRRKPEVAQSPPKL